MDREKRSGPVVSSPIPHEGGVEIGAFVRREPPEEPQEFRLTGKPERSALIPSILIFAGTALLLLHGSLGQPFALWSRGGPGLLAAGLASWLGAAAGVLLLGRSAVAPSENLPAVVTRWLLFALALFFAAERAAWPQMDAPLAWVQWSAAMAMAITAAAILPRLAGMKASLASTRREHDRFLAAAESTLDDFYIFDGVPDESGEIVDFRFSYINPNAERRLGTKRENLVGKILTEVRPFMIRSGLIEKYREVVRTGVPYTCEVFLDDEMIQATWLNVQVVKLGTGIAITSRDVTERKRLMDHVHYLAHYDQLTGLPNRTLLQDRLQQALLRAQRYGQRVAVFLVDVDCFKRINDSLGHQDGDGLLAALGQRLKLAVRESDTVARMGGDEFVIVMPEFDEPGDVWQRGEAIVRSTSQPVALGEREIQVTVSVGISLYPEDGQTADELLRAADRAMYAIKDTGRNGIRMFSGEPSAGIGERPAAEPEGSAG